MSDHFLFLQIEHTRIGKRISQVCYVRKKAFVQLLWIVVTKYIFVNSDLPETKTQCFYLNGNLLMSQICFSKWTPFNIC